MARLVCIAIGGVLQYTRSIVAEAKWLGAVLQHSRLYCNIGPDRLGTVSQYSRGVLWLGKGQEAGCIARQARDIASQARRQGRWALGARARGGRSGHAEHGGRAGHGAATTQSGRPGRGLCTLTGPCWGTVHLT